RCGSSGRASGSRPPSRRRGTPRRRCARAVLPRRAREYDRTCGDSYWHFRLRSRIIRRLASGFVMPYGLRSTTGEAMSTVLAHYAVPVAIGAVAVVLLLGLVNMMRGGSPNTSQKLMRLRVLLQFIAIVIIMATIWVMQR